MSIITIPDKTDRNTQSGDPNSIIAASDWNAFKTSINALYEMIATMTLRTCVTITAANFSGENYTNSKLIGRTPDVDFRIFTNGGSGTLLSNPDGYTFASDTGIITMTPGNYSIEIYTPVPVI